MAGDFFARGRRFDAGILGVFQGKSAKYGGKRSASGGFDNFQTSPKVWSTYLKKQICVFDPVGIRPTGYAKRTSVDYEARRKAAKAAFRGKFRREAQKTYGFFCTVSTIKSGAHVGLRF